MVEAYWEVGRIIVEEEQAGKGRAYARKAGSSMSSPHVSSRRLRQGRRPLLQPLSHAGLLLGSTLFLSYCVTNRLGRTTATCSWVNKPDAGAFHEAEAVRQKRWRWSTRETGQAKIDPLLFDSPRPELGQGGRPRPGTPGARDRGALPTW